MAEACYRGRSDESMYFTVPSGLDGLPRSPKARYKANSANCDCDPLDACISGSHSSYKAGCRLTLAALSPPHRSTTCAGLGIAAAAASRKIVVREKSGKRRETLTDILPGLYPIVYCGPRYKLSPTFHGMSQSQRSRHGSLLSTQAILPPECNDD